MFKATDLYTTALLVALLSAFGFAEPHPRAMELYRLNEILFQPRADLQMPTAISMNMTIRDLSSGTGTTLTSTAIDWSREAARVQTCVDAELIVDAVYKEGTLTLWDAYSGEVATQPVPEGQFRQLMDQALTDPMSLVADVDPADIRYTGPVDYGVIRGEQITVPHEDMDPFAGVPNAGEVGMIFSPEGVWLGMLMQTAAGTMLAVQDGIVVTEIGPSLRGMTMYQPDENGEMQPLVEMRMWNMQAHESLGDEWFSLETLDHPSTAWEREEMRRRLDELSEQVSRMDPLDPDFEVVFAEIEVLGEQLMNYEPVPVPCPEPF